MIGPSPQPVLADQVVLRRRGRRTRWNEIAWGVAFLAPNLTLFFVFMILPLVAGLVLSLFTWDVISPPEFVGLKNFVRLLDDNAIAHAVRTTVIYFIEVVPTSVVLGFFLATLLDIGWRGFRALRVAFFIPIIISLVSSAVIWRWILDSRYGIANFVLERVGIEPVAWLLDPNAAIHALAIVSIWRILPVPILFFTAALQEVPRDLYEAARIDGATGWQLTRHVTWPLVSPTSFFIGITVTTFALFGSFDLVSVMTKGGPSDATSTLVYLVYVLSFEQLLMGYAASLSSVLFVVILLLTILYFRLQSRWVHYA